uniref:IGF-like family receptor 1 n=1 Tax=Sinocyclocheilus anshuiensis TaxID=1608454 RepID=A0A671R7Q9_9TELE
MTHCRHCFKNIGYNPPSSFPSTHSCLASQSLGRFSVTPGRNTSASMTSDRCIEGTFWNRSRYKCEPCETKYESIKGYEFIKNCGWSDEQHQIESPYKPCRGGTFNDGSQVKCQNCRSCPTPQLTASECSTRSDAICWIYVCFGILSTLILVCLFLFIKRRTKPFNEGQSETKGGRIYEGIPVQDAPLKTVLNNLDVLEELVLVLDPDISGAKNTRHLAAQCSFSFAWINYAYSMKDHKSPLVAVLESVVTKNPDWTVSNLAELLTAIGRNDAVEILAKLPAGV